MISLSEAIDSSDILQQIEPVVSEVVPKDSDITSDPISIKKHLPYEDKSKYKHLLSAPISIYIDSARYYNYRVGDTVVEKGISLEVVGSFYINTQPTGSGRSNSFHGSTSVESQFPPASIKEILPHYKPLNCYYFFGARVYVCNKVDWHDYENSPPDIVVYKYLNTLTDETVLIKGEGFSAGEVQ